MRSLFICGNDDNQHHQKKQEGRQHHSKKVGESSTGPKEEGRKQYHSKGKGETKHHSKACDQNRSHQEALLIDMSDELFSMLCTFHRQSCHELDPPHGREGEKRGRRRQNGVHPSDVPFAATRTQQLSLWFPSKSFVGVDLQICMHPSGVFLRAQTQKKKNDVKHTTGQNENYSRKETTGDKTIKHRRETIKHNPGDPLEGLLRVTTKRRQEANKLILKLQFHATGATLHATIKGCFETQTLKHCRETDTASKLGTSSRREEERRTTAVKRSNIRSVPILQSGSGPGTPKFGHLHR